MHALLLVVAIAIAPAASPVRVSGVYFDGYLPGSPEPDSAIRLTNTDRQHAVAIGGFTLTERFTPQKKNAKLTTTSFGAGMSTRGGSQGRKDDDGDDGIRFPQGTMIAPGADIWVAATGTGFLKVFGRWPGYEATPTTPAVTDMDGSGSFLRLPGSRGTVALVDDGGAVVDFVAYDNTKDVQWTEDDFSNLPWRGGPIEVAQTSFYGWNGQVLARDRDDDGFLLADTDGAADWDSGYSVKQLGIEPTHRIERAGQTHFVSKPLVQKARVLATSAPDNNHAALLDAIAAAKKSVRVRIYEFTNPRIGEALVKAKLRGVDVVIYLEGAPVGGIADQERFVLDRCDRAGIPIYFIGGVKKQPVKPRYRFDHSKYVLIDDVKAIIGTENYGRTGVPAINTYGNRGWMVHIENKAFVEQLRAVWDADLQLDARGKSPLADIINIRDDNADSYGMPYRDSTFVPDNTVQQGRYERPVAPVLVDDVVSMELVLSPDTSMNEHSAVLGIIERAKKTLYIEQNSIRRRWGKLSDDPETEGDVPNLALQAVVAAARRGVKTRVLLDSTWYNVQGDEDRDNDDVATWLNDLARREKLDLVAKVINLETAGLQKIHAKGVIGDEREVFVGSINWTENSFKGNREVGVVLGHPKIAGYYSDLFRRDWARSRIYEAPVVVDGGAMRVAVGNDAKVRQKLKKGSTVFVVGEHPRPSGDWLEVRVPNTDDTAFVPATAVGAPTATAAEALHVIGKVATVEGVVVATHVSERRVQLRFADGIRPPFTVVIFTADLEKWKAATPSLDATSAYQGRAVRVTGLVKTYRGPEILVNDPGQLTIIR